MGEGDKTPLSSRPANKQPPSIEPLAELDELVGELVTAVQLERATVAGGANQVLGRFCVRTAQLDARDCAGRHTRAVPAPSRPSTATTMTSSISAASAGDPRFLIDVHGQLQDVVVVVVVADRLYDDSGRRHRHAWLLLQRGSARHPRA